MTKKLLNHPLGSLVGVAAIYNRYSYLDEIKAALPAHDEYLTRLRRADCFTQDPSK